MSVVKLRLIQDDIYFVQHFTYPLNERAIMGRMCTRGAARRIAVQVRKMKVEVLRHIITKNH